MMNQQPNDTQPESNFVNYDLEIYQNCCNCSSNTSAGTCSFCSCSSNGSSNGSSDASSSEPTRDNATHSALGEVMQSIGVPPSQSTSPLNGSALPNPMAQPSFHQFSAFISRNIAPEEWINRISNQIVTDMNNCGICVIDNFLGESRGDVILNEVKSLYSSGHFCNGQLVKNGGTSNADIRSDKIMWVDGNEDECRNVGFLMRTLDKIVRKCTSEPIPGDTSEEGLEKRNITNRTKAMLACYPGSGTHYVKHIDNPNQDGRAITCIYYLNKDWDVEKNGGLLRIFPKGLQYVANIAPMFDRLVFFYSDRRNPHEVQPAFAVRFAITIWYYDAYERERHLQRYQNNNENTLST